MSTKVLLVLPDHVHELLKDYQIDRTTKDRARLNRSQLLAELIEAELPSIAEKLKTSLKEAA